jgi:MFS family permease
MTVAGPLIFGFVATRAGYRWIFWLLAIINGVQCLLYILFPAETRYIPGNEENTKSSSSFLSRRFPFRRIDPTPLAIDEFYHPLALILRPTVSIPAFAYAMVFLFGSVLITVEVPQLLQEKFALNEEQLGLQFLGVIIGTILGEQFGGLLSDKWMNRRARKANGTKSEPEFRLWLAYPGVVLTIVGVVVFLVCTQQAPEGHWEIRPIIGIGVAAFGNQLVTTVLVTYAVDSYPLDSGSVGVCVTFVRQVWGFIGPFWYVPFP